MRWEATFPPELGSARRARAAAAEALRQAGIAPRVVGDAVVVLGEFTSNAARHARTDFTVTVTVQSGTLRIEVADSDTRPPSLLGLDSDSTSGRGLHIVAGLATDWGWRTADGPEGISGKAVWAELALEGL